MSVDRKNISVCAGHRRLALMNGLIRCFKRLFVKMGQHVAFFWFSVVKKWNLCNHSWMVSVILLCSAVLQSKRADVSTFQIRTWWPFPMGTTHLIWWGFFGYMIAKYVSNNGTFCIQGILISFKKYFYLFYISVFSLLFFLQTYVCTVLHYLNGLIF